MSIIVEKEMRYNLMSECNHNCGSCSASCGERTEPQSFLIAIFLQIVSRDSEATIVF